MGVMQKMRERMEKRKEMQKGLRDAGFKNTFMIRGSKGQALLQAEKSRVNIRNFDRMTTIKNINKTKAAVQRKEGDITRINWVIEDLKKKNPSKTEKEIFNTPLGKELQMDRNEYYKEMEKINPKKATTIRKINDAATEEKIKTIKGIADELKKQGIDPNRFLKFAGTAAETKKTRKELILDMEINLELAGINPNLRTEIIDNAERAKKAEDERKKRFEGITIPTVEEEKAWRKLPQEQEINLNNISTGRMTPGQRRAFVSQKLAKKASKFI